MRLALKPTDRARAEWQQENTFRWKSCAHPCILLLVGNR